MKNIWLVVVLLVMSKFSFAQTYQDSIEKFRAHYKQEFLEEEKSPLKEADLKYLKFYPADKNYRVMAQVMIDTTATEIQIPTYNQKEKTFIPYGTLHFTIKGKPCSLKVFQNKKLLEQEKYRHHLFVAFKDETSNRATYGGGRYIDLEATDIVDNKIEVDFNKSYNPYCAFADGYSCPIPPPENRLPVAIKAGEKMYAKPHEKGHK